MKTTLSIITICALVFSISLAAPGDYDKRECKFNNHDYIYDHDYDDDCDYDYDYDYIYKPSRHSCQWNDNNIHMDIENNCVIITHDGWRDDEIKISRSGDLTVNGEFISITSEQRNLLERYYCTAVDIIERAEDLGEKGAAVGIVGAKVGLEAASKAISSIFFEFDTDELEAELEEQTAELEEQAEELEEQAEAVENMADELEDMADELQDEIDELDELRWF